MDYPKIILKPGKELPVLRFHPWIFSGAISLVSEGLQDGDVADIFSSSGKYLATGHFQDSSIAVKIFTFEQQTIDKNFWFNQLAKAYRLREQSGLINNADTNCYRLVHNEGDSLPGLIVDVYNSVAVMQAHSTGMYRLRETIAEVILQLFGNRIKGVYNKSSETLFKNTGMRTMNGWLTGTGGNIVSKENSCSFQVDIESGQKTGFFLDQRENRQLVADYATGRDVLNMFGYTGGFSVYAAKAGANLVYTVDSSASAIETAVANLEMNGFSSERYACSVADARKFLETMDADLFDLIILDPPAYAKNVASRTQALKGYRTLNALALKKIRSDGILFTFSCSQVVDRQMFTSVITAAAVDAGRKVSIIRHLSQPPDHPVNIFHQEGEYLKGLVLAVQ
jgi:23S rRNA (cytosine1962-C5)-methyltransferase